MHTATIEPAAAAERQRVVTDHDIGRALRDQRRDAGQLLHETAERSGIGIKVLSRIERGQRPCRVAEMVSITAALNTDSESVLARAGEIRHEREHGELVTKARAANSVTR